VHCPNIKLKIKNEQCKMLPHEPQRIAHCPNIKLKMNNAKCFRVSHGASRIAHTSIGHHE
jgi:hypothetical protein